MRFFVRKAGLPTIVAAVIMLLSLLGHHRVRPLFYTLACQLSAEAANLGLERRVRLRFLSTYPTLTAYAR